MSSPDRQELVRNAVVFLQDPKTQASSLTQRIQFLEAKGLTPPEIEMAMKQSAVNGTAPGFQQPYLQPYPQGSYLLAPPRQGWDWRDYFVTAVISGAVTYGAVSLFKKYLLPHLQPPSATIYEEDRDALNAQFDAAEAILKDIQNQTTAVRTAVEEQKAKIDKTTEDVEAVVSEMRQGEVKTRDELREIREEVNNVREMLPKMIEKNKESHTHSLNELQQEIKSLKALLLNRPPTIPTTPSPLPILGRPSIPAWQLAGSAGTSTTPNGITDTIPNSSPTVMPSIYPTSSTTIPISNGKGKEIETDSSSSNV